MSEQTVLAALLVLGGLVGGGLAAGVVLDRTDVRVRDAVAHTAATLLAIATLLGHFGGGRR